MSGKKLPAIMFMALLLGLGGCGKGKTGISEECANHDWQWHPVTVHGCTEIYQVQEICAQCGFLGDELSVGPEGHIWTDMVKGQGNCTDPKIIAHVCSVCGAEGEDTVNYEERARELHEYQSCQDSYVDMEYNALIVYECDRCARCGKEINRQQTDCRPIVPEEAR